MRFKEVTDEGIIRSVVNGYKRTKVYCLIDEFIESGVKVAEVDTEGYKSATTCTASINASVKRYGIPNVVAVTAEGKTYIVNKEKV